MSVKTNTTKMENMSNVTVREIDFVTRFGRNWEALREILGITKAVKKTPGTRITAYEGEITLESGNVAEGDEIPYSLAQVVPKDLGDVTIEKYAKAVSIESVAKYGAEIAVAKTDDAMLAKLQTAIINKFYNFIKTGTLTVVESGFQAGLAMAKGHVLNMWRAMDRDITDIVGFVNVLDFYQYLGQAQVTVQTAFGMEYVKDFMGYNTIFLIDGNRIPRNTIIATPVENVVTYFVDPADSDFAKLGLEYTTDGEGNMIGFHVDGNYGHAVGEVYAIMGITMFAEYLNGIAVVTVDAGSTAKAVTVASAAGSKSGDTAITVTYTLGAGEKAYYIVGDTAATVTYKATLDTTDWTELTYTSGVAGQFTAASGKHFTVAVVNGAGQVVATGDATVTAKA